jgi:predicted transcriptional regulator
MDLSRPFAVVTTAVDGDVLAALAAADASFTGRELHRVIGRHSQTGVNRVLNRLVAQGVVERTRAGSARIYRLNRDHLVARHLVGIAGARDELVQRLQDSMADWDEPPVFAALFGSTARDESDEASDLDLLLVHRDEVDPDDDPWSGQMDDLLAAVSRWTGNDVRPVTFSRSEARAAIRGKEPFLSAIRLNAITLIGNATFLQPTSRRTAE